MKKSRLRSSATSTTTPQRPRRRAVQYVLVFVGFIILVDAVVGDKGLMTILKARQEYRELESSLERARTENARLREQARRLREDPSAVEEIARRELGLVKPGEKLFIVKDVEPPDSRSASD